MSEGKPKINIGQLSFRLDESVRDQFTGKLRQRSTDVKEAMTRLVKAYLAEEPNAVALLEATEVPVQKPAASGKPLIDQHAAPGYAHSTDAWLVILKNILDSGHSVAIEAITRNLLAFDRLIKSDQGSADASYIISTPEELRTAANLARAGDRVRRAQKADGGGAAVPPKRDTKRKGS